MIRKSFRKVRIGAFFFLGLAVVTAAGQGPWQAWKHRLPIVLGERNAAVADRLPVDLTFSMFAADLGDPKKEIRLVLKTDKGEVAVPFQLSRLSTWDRDTDGAKSLPTVSGRITFFDVAPGSGPAEYFILYGNPAAQAPDFTTDLKVSGKAPAWTVENAKMKARLQGRMPEGSPLPEAAPTNRTALQAARPAHPSNYDSGQLAAVTLKSRPAWPIAPYTGVMHWEPGIFVPTRGWIHVFDWNPPPVCEIEQGPLFVEVRRSGPFPKVPEVNVSVTYRFFAGRAYVEASTGIEVVAPVGVVSLRNLNMVFDNGTFSHMAWLRDGAPVVADLKDYPPVNTHNDVLRLADDIPFFALLNPVQGVGVATIKDLYANHGPDGTAPALFDNSFYMSNGGNEGLQYFFRPLVYFNVGWDRKQLVTLAKGSVYAERNYFLFFEADGDKPIQDVLELAAAAGKKPSVAVGPFKMPPAR